MSTVYNANCCYWLMAVAEEKNKQKMGLFMSKIHSVVPIDHG